MNNFKIPPLALLQPRASLRAKEKETVLWNETLSSKEARIHRKRKEGSRPSSSPRRYPPDTGTTTGNRLSGEEHQPTCFAFIFQRHCPTGTACDHWHPPVCSMRRQEIWTIGKKCALKHSEKILSPKHWIAHPTKKSYCAYILVNWEHLGGQARPGPLKFRAPCFSLRSGHPDFICP